MPDFALSRHAVEWWAHHNFTVPGEDEPDTFLQQKGAHLEQVLGVTNLRTAFVAVLRGNDMALFPDGISERTQPTVEVLAVFALVMRHVILSGSEANATWRRLNEALRQVSISAPDHEDAWRYWDATMRQWQDVVNANADFTKKFGRIADLEPLSAVAPPEPLPPPPEPLPPPPEPTPPPPREAEMRILRRQLAAVRADLAAMRLSVAAAKRRAQETEAWDQDNVLDLLDELG